MDNLFSLKTVGNITDLHSGIRWSAQDLRQQVSIRLPCLWELDITSGDIVLITHGRSLEFFADLFSVWMLGGCAACLNPLLTVNELENVAAFVQPKAILTSKGQSPSLARLAIPVLELANVSETTVSLPVSTDARVDDPALILFTSGTTGDPKGVVHTFGSLSARLSHNRENLSDESLARSLCVLPTHFGHGLIGNCLTPLSADQDLLLFQNPGIAGAAQLGEVIDNHKITFLSSVASFWKLVIKTSPTPQCSTLRQVSVGSAPLSSHLWSQIIQWSGQNNVSNMYGITETANWVAGASASEYEPENGLVGKMWGGEAAVITQAGQRQMNGEGEIVLKTPSLMQGYFQRADLTEGVVLDGWYKTGDWGAIDEHGVIRLLGRTKTEINKAGIKILPEEVDLLLEGHRAVAEACAFAVPDAISGETVAAAVCIKADDHTTISDLRAWCAERIRPDCVPEKWYIVDDIPKTDRGKVNRQLVHDYCLRGGLKND